MSEELRLITEMQFSEKLGFRGRTSIWRLKKSDPDFPKTVCVGGSERYVDREADDFIRAKINQRGE
jgi:predicted DNA-binding transcriptional regulator AlpA